MTAHAGETKTFRLSDRLSVDITASPIGIVVEWDPEIPEDLTTTELLAYRRARHEVLEHLSQRLGKRIGVIEI